MRRQKVPKKGSIDRHFLILTIVMTFVGIIAVADASAPQAQSVFSDSYYFAKQQFFWAIVGFVAMAVASYFDYKLLNKLAWPIFFLGLAMLIAVLLPGFGSKILGARRWISLGPFSFQPSEYVKLATAIIFARLANKNASPYYYIGILVFVAGLIMLQPDLGTTIVIVAIGFAQMFVLGFPLINLIMFGGIGALGVAALIVSSSYRRARLMSFIENTSDPLGSSYHIRQILIALGSGGVFGVGIGASRQKHLFLPETATDSVFAVLAEEIGFIGATAIILLLTYYIYRGVKIAMSAPDDFSTVLAAGLVTWIGAQTFLNISSMVALTPLTGIPLPFFSYGGTSLTMNLVSAGILLNISKYANEK